MRHFLVESLLLALAGGVLGVLFALWGKDFLLALWPAGTPRPASVPLSWATVFAASAVAALVGVVVGAVPAWRGASVGMAETLRVVAVPRAGRLRAGLAIVQHAVAILVLVGAALLGKSLLKLVAVNPGFDPANVVTVDVSLPDQRYPDDVSRRAFFEAVIDRMAAQPGVLQASAVSNLPFGNSFSSGSFEIEGRPPFPNDDKPSTGKMLVDGDFFKTMRIPVLEGRPFARGEHRLELMINKTFADRFFPEGAIGQRIDTWGGFGDVVGVVADVHRQGLDDPPELQAYVNFQRTLPWVTFVVRVTGDPARSFSALKSQVYAVDPQLAVASVGTMDDHIAQSAASRRVVATMVAAFAVVALVLAALGIYGVLAYSVSQRTREIGVRMALGARSTTVLALILGQGMRLALAGTIIGLGAALGLARTFDAFLFGVSASDPLIYGGVALLLLGVGLVACLVPALRAASVDPMSALRAD